jgi:glucose-1-phosphate adenylyltransferase
LLGERSFFELQNTTWPIWTDNSDAPPAALGRARLDDVLVGQGTRIVGADIRRSVIGRNVTIEPGAQVEECIILDGAVIGERARLRRVIADRFNRIPPGSQITADTAGALRGARVSTPDLVVLPQGLLSGDEVELALTAPERP